MDKELIYHDLYWRRDTLIKELRKYFDKTGLVPDQSYIDRVDELDRKIMEVRHGR